MDHTIPRLTTQHVTVRLQRLARGVRDARTFIIVIIVLRSLRRDTVKESVQRARTRFKSHHFLIRRRFVDIRNNRGTVVLVFIVMFYFFTTVHLDRVPTTDDEEFDLP